MKKIILSFAFVLAVFGDDIEKDNLKYLDESKLELTDLRIFVGTNGTYSYYKSNENLDTSGYGYGLYAGIPVSDMEIILQKKYHNSQDFNLDSTSMALNVPIGGTGSRVIYAGVSTGNANVTYSDSLSTNLNLINKKNDSTFYGIHIGKRYKFGQNFFTRVELEYLKYNLSSKTTSSKILNLDSTLGFVYGVEYRF